MPPSIILRFFAVDIPKLRPFYTPTVRKTARKWRSLDRVRVQNWVEDEDFGGGAVVYGGILTRSYGWPNEGWQ